MGWLLSSISVKSSAITYSDISSPSSSLPSFWGSTYICVRQFDIVLHVCLRHSFCFVFVVSFILLVIHFGSFLSF